MCNCCNVLMSNLSKIIIIIIIMIFICKKLSDAI